MRIDHYIHFDPWPDEAPPWAVELMNQGDLVLNRLENVMATLDQVLNDVKAENTQLDSLGAYIAGLKQQITDALSGATLPPDVQVKIDAVFAQQEANTAKIAAAMNTTSTVPAPVIPAPTAPLPVDTTPVPTTEPVPPATT